jgi:hypothetical protein
MNNQHSPDAQPFSDQPSFLYSSTLHTEWVPFTPRHQQGLEDALAIARREVTQPVGAIVGIYGSGKSTLLLTVLRRAIAGGTLAVWEEAAAFIERLVPRDQKVTPQEFSRRVHTWLKDLQDDAAILHEYCCSLEERGHPGIADIVRSAVASPKTHTVVLLDEME